MKRINNLLIISVLKKYSSKSNPLDLTSIEDYLRKESFYLLNPDKSTPNRSTIERFLDEIIGESPEDDLSFSPQGGLQLGYYIRRCVKAKSGTGYELYETEDPDADLIPASAAKKSPKKFYYYQSILDPSEISLLTYALETQYAFSSEEISGLIKKLRSILPGEGDDATPPYYKPDYYAEPQTILIDNIRNLEDLIQKKLFAEVKNGYYDEKHKLQPYDRPARRIRPIRILFTNGFYYLLAVTFRPEKEAYVLVHYRVDRLVEIRGVEPSEKERQDYAYTEPVEPAVYRQCHPSMFGEKPEQIRFLALNIPMVTNVLTDYFGNWAKIHPASPADISRYLPQERRQDSWLSVTVSAARSGVRLFAIQFCEYIRIIPEDLASEVNEILAKGRSLYQA